MIGKLDDYLRFNEAALSLRSQRQQLIASNIANADTPNYKARDIDFASALQGVMARTRAAGRRAGGHRRRPISAAPRRMPTCCRTARQVQYRGVVQGAVDGNTVDMDVERNQFADNAVRYEAGITMINMQIRGLMAAIQGGQ